MTATLFLTDRDTGKTLAARVVEIDHGGKIVGATFAPARLGDGTLSYEEAVRRTGAAWHIVRDFGHGVTQVLYEILSLRNYLLPRMRNPFQAPESTPHP
jgi:hypothetical protein